MNLVTATTLGVALAFEPTEERTMRRPPRPRAAPLLTGELLWLVALAALLFLAGVLGIHGYALQRGYPVELARTLALNTLVVMEIFYLFFVRNLHGASLTWRAARGTPAVWAAVLTVTAAQFAVTYLSPLQAVFETRPVALADGLLVVAIGALLLAVIEGENSFACACGAADAPSQRRRQVVPPGPSSSTMPASVSSARMASARAKSRALRASIRACTSASMSASDGPAPTAPPFRNACGLSCNRPSTPPR